jgi:phosphate transport system permease protein
MSVDVGLPPPPPAAPAPEGKPRKPVVRLGDRIFFGAALGAGTTILVVLAGVALFLVIKAWPAVTADSSELPNSESLPHYIGPLAFGTILGAVIALLLAAPMAIAIALYITHYAPARFAGPLGLTVDLLAAVPSIIYGLWGIQVLAPHTVPLSRWLEDHLGFLPLFNGPASSTGRTMLTVGIVLAVMILPVSTAISREVFKQTPVLHQEAALALGATRWEMIRMTVLPFGRSGVISGAMLGLGRALGETMAVAIILSVSNVVTFDLIGRGNSGTIAAKIALDFPESSGTKINALIAAGLVLFAITLAVNMIARAIINRRREFSGAN